MSRMRGCAKFTKSFICSGLDLVAAKLAACAKNYAACLTTRQKLLFYVLRLVRVVARDTFRRAAANPSPEFGLLEMSAGKQTEAGATLFQFEIEIAVLPVFGRRLEQNFWRRFGHE